MWAVEAYSEAITNGTQVAPVVNNYNTTTTTTTNGGATDGGTYDSGLRYVDQNIQANSNTSDGPAENVFKAYWNTGNSTDGWSDASVSAYSPASSQSYSFSCSTDQTTVTCYGTDTSGNSLDVTFPMQPVQVY